MDSEASFYEQILPVVVSTDVGLTAMTSAGAARSPNRVGYRSPRRHDFDFDYPTATAH